MESVKRNESLIFTEKEFVKIDEVFNSFSIIAMKMGVDIITRGITLATNKNEIELSYIGRGRRIYKNYKKSITKTWDDILNNIKADLFEELKRMC